MKVSGTVKAFTFMHLPTLGGDIRTRKVSLGTEYCVDMETAQDMVNELRERAKNGYPFDDMSNRPTILNVHAQFTAEL